MLVPVAAVRPSAVLSSPARVTRVRTAALWPLSAAARLVPMIEPARPYQHSVRVLELPEASLYPAEPGGVRSRASAEALEAAERSEIRLGPTLQRRRR